MATIEYVIQRWVNIQTGKTTRRNLTGTNVFGSHDRLYSYGMHFELARPLMSKGEHVAWLLNGDRYSVSTTRHQNTVRAVIERSSTLPKLIIPHSVLRAARLQINTIELVDASPDTYDMQLVRVHKPAHWMKRWDGPLDTMREPDRSNWSQYYAADEHGRLWSYRNVHRLGESVIRARDAAGRLATYLSGWDHNDNTYFFCEVPDPEFKIASVAEAYEALKPESVKIAEKAGLPVERQGDIFAIPTEFTTRELTKMGAVRERSASIFTTNHQATELAKLPNGLVFCRGWLRHKPAFRRPDHRAVELGRQWALVVKNTVPFEARA